MDGLAVGRMCHYVTADDTCHAAIVCNVIDKDQGIVNLMVFNADLAGVVLPGQLGPATPMHSVQHSEKKMIGRWHWIEKA